jgi:uncharacterized repeat protein (TIGR01451 family)
MTITDANGNATHTYAITGASVTRGGGSPINYTNLANVSVIGGTLSDTFNVTPSATTAFIISGGQPNPPAHPGDALNVNLTGAINPNVNEMFNLATGYSGQWTFSNLQPISFSQIETPLPGDDLSVTKTAPSTVAAGTYLTYSITVKDSGPVPASNVVLTDPLPANTTFVSYMAPGGWTPSTPNVGSGGTVTFTDSSVATGSYQFTIVVRVSGSLGNGTVLTNKATIKSDTFDPDLSNNSFTATTTVQTSVITSLGVTQNIPKQTTATLTGTFTNPIPADALVLTVNWGDGTVLMYNLAAGATSFSETHKYTKVGYYSITTSLSDPTAGSRSPSKTVTTNVVNVPPVINPISGPTKGTMGVPLTWSDTFTDNDPASTVQVSWSIMADVSSAPPVYSVPFHPATDAGALSITFTFSKPGTYTVSFSVKDQYGLVKTVQLPITITA